jgi:Arc/MetJ family transcription regulator
MTVRKTTIEIDTDVIAEVQGILGTKGIKDTVDAALLAVRRREAWRRHKAWLEEVGPDLLSPEAARWRDDID